MAKITHLTIQLFKTFCAESRKCYISFVHIYLLHVHVGTYSSNASFNLRLVKVTNVGDYCTPIVYDHCYNVKQ